MTALEAQVAEMRRLGQFEAACDTALAAGNWPLAAQLASEGGAHRRAAGIWQRIEAWTQADAAWLAAGSATEAGRLRLQTGRPLDALRVLPADAKTLRAIAFAQLSCWHAAVELLPALAGPNHGLLAQLAAQADAQPHATRLRFAQAEPDAPGCGWAGWLADAYVATRVLPNRQAYAQTLAVLDPPLAGVVRLVDTDPTARRVTTRRPGVGLRQFARQAASDVVARIFERTAEILRAAHRRGCVHGMILDSDVRVLPASGVAIDGWHRRHLEPVDGPWSARLDAATPPEIAVGQTATPAADVWCIARLRARYDQPVHADASAPDPTIRPAL